MKLFFEEYPYDEAELRKYFDNKVNLSYQKNGKARLPYVGYYYDSEKRDVFFILPKVFISERELAFDKYDPANIIDLSPDDNPLKKERDDEVVFELSAWLYQAIKRFYERNKNTEITDEVLVQNIKPRGEKGSKTIIEIILSLIEFNKLHRNMFTYISIVNSSGKSKINWGKTIRKESPIIQDETPCYLNLLRKKKVINFDEELISLYYSVLNYLNNSFHFRLQIIPGYEILKPSKIKSLIDYGKGTRLLKSIRSKYFTDELVGLWNLMYEFFDRYENKSSSKTYNEILLTKNFNNIFEDMIDQIISDNDYPAELKNQKDNKEVDHLYVDKSIVDADKRIYFIGDSKYYKENNELEKKSIYKQYTYAKNVIQTNIDWFNARKNDPTIRYRDNLTEGYNITPNFFIRGIIDFQNPRNYEKLPKLDEQKIEFNRHFSNRLFDRDTLLLQSYNINFFFVMVSYVRNSNNQQIKAKIKEKFKNDFTNYIESQFDFYILEPRNSSLQSLVEKHFKKLIGKIYKPTDSHNLLILALEKKQEFIRDNLELLADIEEDFIIHEYHFGKTPEEVLKSDQYSVIKSIENKIWKERSENENDEKYKAYDTSETVLLGIYKNLKHLNWITENKKYNVRLGDRIGAVKRNHQVISAKYLVLYDVKDETRYFIFKLSDKHHVWDFAKMSESGYPVNEKHKSNKYYIYNIEEETEEFGRVDLKSLLMAKHEQITGLPEGNPIYVDKKDIEQFKI